MFCISLRFPLSRRVTYFTALRPQAGKTLSNVEGAQEADGGLAAAAERAAEVEEKEGGWHPEDHDAARISPEGDGAGAG